VEETRRGSRGGDAQTRDALREFLRERWSAGHLEVQRAIGNFERALRLSPIDPMNFNNYVGLGSAHEVAQEYDEAGFYRRALEERPTAGWIYRNVAFVSVGGRLSRRG
jgi:hypothetical protein